MTCWLCGFETELATNAEAPTCENGPCHICIAVAKVEEEINQAVVTLRRLLSLTLRSEQNRVHGTLIYRLPAELKNYIFELLLPLWDEWGEIHGIEKPNKPVMPLYLTSICRSWRDIALSNSFLWCKLHIAIGTQSTSSFVHNWILRSRTLPLTVHIVYEKEGTEEELKCVIDIISQCSNRCHSLFLDIPLRVLPAFYLSDVQYNSLRRLRIMASRGWQEEINQLTPLLNPKVSPEEIEICGVPFHSLQISWNHLFSAKITSINLEEIAQLFQHASQMTYCHISILLRCPRSLSISMPSIFHQRLKIMSLGDILECGIYVPSFSQTSLSSRIQYRRNVSPEASPCTCASLILSLN